MRAHGEIARARIAGPACGHTWTQRATKDSYTRIEATEPRDAPLDGDAAALMAHAPSNPIYFQIAGQ
jgi:hypothetical protein